MGDFRAAGVARTLAQPAQSPTDVALTPFYRTHGRTYSIYFDVVTSAEFDARVAANAAASAHERALEAATVAFLEPGDNAAEQQYDYHSEPADRPVVRTGRRTARGGAGWFSYDLPADTGGDASLAVTYYNDLGLPVLANFNISVDEATVGHYVPNRAAGSFWTATYRVPAAVVAGKRTVTVKFAAASDGRIAPVYGVRLVRGTP
jgi:hypothetical protein